MSDTNNISQRYRSRAFSLLVHIFLFISIMPKSASAESPSIEKTIFIKTDSDAPIDPQVVARDHDGGFIVGGTADNKAWAIKLDAEGRDVWRYYAKQEPNKYVGLPEFRGIAPMSDGSVYLCGVAPQPWESNLPTAFVTHLDAGGRVISEKLVVPTDQVANFRNLSSFDACTRWGDGVVFLGDVLTVIRPGAKNVTPIVKNYYWIIAIDSRGNTKWDKLIEFSFGEASIVVSQYISLAASDATFLFAVTDSNYTEILSVDTDGNVKKRTRIKGFFRLIKPSINDDSLVQLWGGIPGSGVTSIIDMDSSLKEINRVDDSSDSYQPRFLFRMPNKSIISFGQGKHFLGRSYRAEGVRIDPLFKNRQTINLEQEDFIDAGQIGAAVEGSRAGQFVVAKSVVTKALMEGLAGPPGKSAEFKRGLSIEFVNF